MKRLLQTTGAAVAVIFAAVSGHGQVSAQQAAPTVPTFSKQVAPILYKSCVSCHRAGEVAPMSLITYDEVRPWARSIKQKVVSRTMPPWLADPHFSDLKFQNDRTLTQQEIDTVAAWADGGSPRGDEKDLPPAPEFGDGWKYGKPDYVIKMPKAYDLPAEGQIDYLSFYVPVPFDKDVFVEKIEMKPSNKAVVHHETGWAVTLRDDMKLVDGVPYSLDGKLLNKNEVRPQGTSVFESQGMSKLICYVPGRGYEEHRPGTAKRIAAGKNKYIQFDVHYQPSGQPEKDQSEIGLYFSKVPVTHEVITEMVGGGFEGMRIVEGREPPSEVVTVNGVSRRRTKIPNIPPYAENWAITAITPVPEAITLYGLSPHMHLRGKDMKYIVIYPDGQQKPILSVPKYDFNWQLYYELQTPKKIPAGSKVTVVTLFDNSPKNRYNPAPEKEVFWSEQSWDEMYEPYIEYTVDNQDLTKKPTTTRPQQ